MSLWEYKKKFDPMATAFLRSKQREIKRDLVDPSLRTIPGYIQTLFEAGGKRIRPYVANLAYESAGGKRAKEAQKLFVAFELFHLFCLIHDDIIDRGQSRHGVATTHIFVEAELRRLKRSGDLPHVGEGQAILAGDLAFAWSQEIFQMGDGKKFPHFQQAREEFQRMIQEVILGQMIDVDLMSRERTTSCVIRRKIELKTARYSFVRPMRVGGMLAGARPSFLSFCEKFGLALGTAFQIQDDLLDLTSTTAKLQKGVFSDLEDRQHTLFTQHIFEKGTRGEQSMLKRYFGKKIDKKDGTKILSLFHESGAIQAGSSEMERSFKRAEVSLLAVEISQEKKGEWLELVQLIRQRIS